MDQFWAKHLQTISPFSKIEKIHNSKGTHSKVIKKCKKR